MFPARSKIIEIKSLEEINQLFRVQYDYALTKHTYRRPLRSYELINPDAKCQFLKKNKSCGQAHQHGYVVETSDDKQVLIGHCCALNHLGLDDEKVKNDFREVSSAERDAIRRGKIENLLATKDELICDVKRVLTQVKSLNAQANRVLGIMPSKVVDALIDRWKRNALKVNCEYLIIRRGKDESGRDVEEKSWYPHECGTLKGLGQWLEFEKLTLMRQLYDFLRKLESIPVKKRLRKDELISAESVFNELSALAILKREIEVQRGLIDHFCVLSNLIVTVQLFADRELRAKVVDAIYQLSGESLEVPSSRIVNEIDRSIRERYKADGLRIAS